MKIGLKIKIEYAFQICEILDLWPVLEIK